MGSNRDAFGQRSLLGAGGLWRRLRLAVPLWAVPLWAAIAASPSWAITRDEGNIAVVEDATGAVHNTEGFWGPDQTCRETAKLFYRCHADDYDVLVAFDAKTQTGPDGFIRNVQQGTPVKNDIGGIGYINWNFTARYGSAGKLGHCVGMASLASIPNSPDGPATVFLGLPLGITGVELLGHELGHKWLMGVSFDKRDDGGVRTFIRGYENDSANLHYSGWANSRSVMYGNFINDKGDGSYEVCGGERGYNELDQYLMGLRPASEVPPMLVLSDGSGQGNPSVPNSRGACSIQRNLTRVDVTVDDVIRASGARTPAYGTAQRTWRIGFMLVTEPGVDATAAQLAKVETYRARFTSWFTTATGGRGTADTHLGPFTCVPSDGGVDGGVVRDGGKPPEDGGASPVDAGTLRDAGLDLDAGTMLDAGLGGDDAGFAPSDDGGPRLDAGAHFDAGVRRDGGGGGGGGSGGGGGGSVSGCSCEVSSERPTTGGNAATWLALAALCVAIARRRRRR